MVVLHPPVMLTCLIGMIRYTSSLTLESDDAGSGKGHNFYTSVAVRAVNFRENLKARLLVCRLGRIKTSVDQM